MPEIVESAGMSERAPATSRGAFHGGSTNGRLSSDTTGGSLVDPAPPPRSRMRAPRAHNDAACGRDHVADVGVGGLVLRARVLPDRDHEPDPPSVLLASTTAASIAFAASDGDDVARA